MNFLRHLHDKRREKFNYLVFNTGYRIQTTVNKLVTTIKIK